MAEKYTIKIENFEGPFDLLFHLIEKNKIDIYDIPIALITEQYIEYIETMKEMDLEVASEFLVMAATLLHIKSRMLLPKQKDEDNEDEQIDPREELVIRLLEYKKYKDFAEDLKEREKIQSMVYYKLPEIIEETENLKPQLIGLNVEDLILAFNKIFERSSKIKEVVKTDFSQLVYREKVSVGKKIKDIARLLKNNPRVSFTSLFDPQCSKIEVVATFLAILELIKLKKIFAKQDANYSDIMIFRSEKQIEIDSILN